MLSRNHLSKGFLMRSAVLVLGFNRPKSLRRLIRALRSAKPQRVYFAIDGARESVAGEAALVLESQSLIGEIDWTSEVHSLFRRKNLGCGRAVSEAITWFMDGEEEGIVLEDDLVPQAGFFEFCDYHLERWRNYPQVFAVSGSSYVPRNRLSRPEMSFRTSRRTNVWGWATWRRSWQQVSLNTDEWTTRIYESGMWEAMDKSLTSAVYLSLMRSRVARSQIDTWDVQMNFCQMASGQVTVTSNVNLVENCGFSKDATHTRFKPLFLTQGLVQPEQSTIRISDVDEQQLLPADVRADRWQTRAFLIEAFRQRVLRALGS